MNFNHYYTNQELDTTLHEWAQVYPRIISVTELGRSYEERPIWLLTITNHESGPDTEKPAVWIDANIHATEIAGTTTALKLVHTLLGEYGKNQEITRLLDTSVYYIVPRLNPDGAELAMAEIPQYVRSGVRPYPWEEKGEGLHSQDIDRDGRILQMRIKDPNGNWKISSLDSRLMERRDPDEQGGEYYRILPEGSLEDYDGYQIKLAKSYHGLDFNRNFPLDWRPEADQQGAGPYPVSEPEIKAMVDFITDHHNINAALTYHTYSGVILRPLSSQPDEDMDTNDLWVYKAVAKRGTELTGYPNLSVYHDFRYHPKEITTGAFDDWVYNHLGIFAFTVELWDIVGRAGIAERKYIEWLRDHPHDDDLKILKWADENAGEGAYVDWYEYNHPQLGAIELGGWNNFYTWRNPPHHLMGEEAERNVPFALALGYMLPHLDIHTLKVSKVSESTFTLNLVVDNSGFLPSYTSNQGKKRGAMREVRVELELPKEVEILNGRQKSVLGHLEGRSNKIGQTFIAATPTDNRGRLEWTFKAPQGSVIKLHILSERAGKLHREVILE